MQSEISKKVIKLITQMPGISGIVSLNFNDELNILSPDEFEKGISVIFKGQGSYIINVAILVSSYVRSKVVIREITEVIKNALKKDKIDIDKINIYVRGVS